MQAMQESESLVLSHTKSISLLHKSYRETWGALLDITTKMAAILISKDVISNFYSFLTINMKSQKWLLESLSLKNLAVTFTFKH